MDAGCVEVLDRCGRAGGARPFSLDADQAQRSADMFVYIRQHHGEQDLARLGRIVLEDDRWP